MNQKPPANKILVSGTKLTQLTLKRTEINCWFLHRYAWTRVSISLASPEIRECELEIRANFLVVISNASLRDQVKYTAEDARGNSPKVLMDFDIGNCIGKSTNTWK